MAAQCLAPPKKSIYLASPQRVSPQRISPQRVLVTGGTGFIGSHLASELYERGYEVIITGTQTEQNTRCHKFLQLNLSGIDWKELGCIDICFHQAANNDTTDKDHKGMMLANVESPINLFEHLALNGCRKFIYASSSAVYGNSPAPFKEDETPLKPLNAYAESKVAFDNYIQNEFLKKYEASVVGLRYTNVYGPGEDHKKKRASMIHQIVQKAMRDEEILLFKDGKQKRDWVYIDDVVHANMLAIDYSGSNIFNCGSGEAVTFNFLIEAIGYTLWRNLNVRYIDCPFKEAYQEFTLADMSKAEKELKHIPAFLATEGIQELIEQIKKGQL